VGEKAKFDAPKRFFGRYKRLLVDSLHHHLSSIMGGERFSLFIAPRSIAAGWRDHILHP